jgi:AraC-like DNA-binding protein
MTYEVTGSPTVQPPTTSSACPLAAWHEQFRQRLGEAIENGGPSLDTIARSLSVSRRTVQRRLAALGTTWRAELDTTRRRRAQQAREAGTTSTRLARQLGYADPRSARRALRRWDNGAAQ